MAAGTSTTDERAFQLLGLVWAGLVRGTSASGQGSRALLAEQRPDGGWAQLPTLTSDAYATGQALVALLEAGALRAVRLRLPPRCRLPARLTARGWVVVP